MHPNELGEFSVALSEAARVIGKTIGEKDVKPLFNYLTGYPLKVVIEGMERALRKRDPDDIFQKTVLLTGPEIEQAAKEIMNKELPEGMEGKVRSCKLCEGRGWHTQRVKDGRLEAHPCRCLYESVQESLRRRKRPGATDESLDGYRKRVIFAYEFHQKKWGDQ